jgi:hypothetical protein
MKIWPAGLVQGYNLAVDNGIGGQIPECLSDLREPFVEVLVVPRIEKSFAAGFDGDGSISVKLNFVNPIRAQEESRPKCSPSAR